MIKLTITCLFKETFLICTWAAFRSLKFKTGFKFFKNKNTLSYSSEDSYEVLHYILVSMRKVRFHIFSPVTNHRVIKDHLVDSPTHCVIYYLVVILASPGILLTDSGPQCLQAIALLKLVAGWKLTFFWTKTSLYITSSQ